MATENICVNDGAVAQTASVFEGLAQGYQSFTMMQISSYTPVPGGAIHDEIGVHVKNSLDAWSNLMHSDAQDIDFTGNTLSDVDKSMAHKLLGMGWPDGSIRSY